MSGGRTAGTLEHDNERVDRVSTALAKAGLDAFVCALPSNVLLLTGYWPVIGNAIAVATRNGDIGVLAPEDELDYARNSWADYVSTFAPASLERIESPFDAVRDPLRDMVAALRLADRARIGFEGSGSFDPCGYASEFEYGAGMNRLLPSALHDPALDDATSLLARLRSLLTPREIGMVRRACDIAARAFAGARSRLTAGASELDIAAALRSGLVDGDRCDGFAYCMSGPNSARAYAAYQRSTTRELQAGDFVLLHCNSYCGGFWTDITRTFVIGAPNREQEKIYDAVRRATDTAFAAVLPGAATAGVDHAARAVMNERGYARQFKHATGHGVGFSAINHNAPPRIHPASSETLEPGMIFNIEPAVYLDGSGGLRQCNMALVTAEGVECLTPFLNETRELQVA